MVDTHGKIVFVGHPADRSLEEDIDNLLKGEKITGEGTEAAGGAADNVEEIADASYEELSTKFKSEAKKICKDQKSNAAKLQRAYLVMVVDATWDPQTEKLMGTMQVITQLTGESGARDKVHAAIMPLTNTKGWEVKEIIK